MSETPVFLDTDLTVEEFELIRNELKAIEKERYEDAKFILEAWRERASKLYAPVKVQFD